MLACSASEQSDLSVCPHLLLSSATQKCLRALLLPKIPLLQLFPIKALQEGCSKQIILCQPLMKKRKHVGCFIQTTCQDLSQKLREMGRRRIQKTTFFGMSIICFAALQWNTWMEGLFCRRGRMTNCSQPVTGALLGGRFIAASDSFEDRGKGL